MDQAGHWRGACGELLRDKTLPYRGRPAVKCLPDTAVILVLLLAWLVCEGYGKTREMTSGLLGIGPLGAHCQAVSDEAVSNPLQAGNNQSWWFNVVSSFNTAGTGVG